ncbi:MAG: hypothetical protein P0Y60_04835 [Candidatus Microbacterium colombiense]|nr:MAG: hypothetical protein P0Y60_04835 [Microbacterium sp.]
MDCKPADDICHQLEEVARALNDPWDGFGGVLLASIIGALVGAGAAFFFAWMLRKQQKKDEKITRDAIAETERLHRLDDSLRLTVGALNDLARAWVVSSLYATAENLAELARTQWTATAHLRTTRLSMSPADYPVLHAAFEYLRNLSPTSGQEAMNADRLARILMLWRSGEKDTEWILAALNRRYNSTAVNE